MAATRRGRPAPELDRATLATPLGKLAMRVRELRAGRDVRELAAKAGIGFAVWYKLERAENDPSFGTLVAIADALGTPLAKLVS